VRSLSPPSYWSGELRTTSCRSCCSARRVRYRHQLTGDLSLACSEIARVLRPGGPAIFVEPLGHNPLINAYRKRTPALRTVDEHPPTKARFVRSAGGERERRSSLRCAAWPAGPATSERDATLLRG
jgi:hypothetical protein